MTAKNRKNRVAWLPRVLIPAFVACVTACASTIQRPAELNRWLQCDECVDGELDSVVGLQSRAVEALVDALHGPSSDRVENMRRQFAASYARVVARTDPSTLNITEATYVRRYLENYVATYRSRSAIALGRIGTDAAVNALRAAQDSSYRFDVLFEIRRALADSMTIVEGDGQTDRVGATLPIDPAVLVTDGLGNPVVQLPVTFVADSGNGIVLGGATRTDDATGIARAGWTLGPVPGTHTLRVTAGNLTARFEATATSAPGPVLTLNAGQSQDAPVGTAVSIPPSVLVTDGAGIPVAGFAVTFTVTFGGGSVTGTTATADTAGIAQVGSWTLGPAFGGLNSLRATAPGAADSVTFTAVGTRQPPASITIVDGDNQTATVGTPVPTAPSVLVTDASGSPLSGIAVIFSVLTGGGTVTEAIQTTNSDGIATVGSWTTGPVEGANTLRAATLTLPGVTFTGYGTAPGR